MNTSTWYQSSALMADKKSYGDMFSLDSKSVYMIIEFDRGKFLNITVYQAYSYIYIEREYIYIIYIYILVLNKLTHHIEGSRRAECRMVFRV